MANSFSFSNKIMFNSEIGIQKRMYLSNQEFETQVNVAVDVLSRGHVLALPTDTIYGLAGSVQNDSAVAQLYEIKGRDQSKPFSICVSDIDDIKTWADVTPIPPQLLQSLMPGPYTIVLDRSAALNPSFNPTNTKVGVRIPKHDFVIEIVKRLGLPLALTSANTSGKESTLAAEEFMHLWPKISVVFDGGRITSTMRTGSTVVDLSNKGKFKIVRPGVNFEELVDKLRSHGLVQCQH